MAKGDDFIEGLEADAKEQEVKDALGDGGEWEEVNPMSDDIYSFEKKNDTLVGTYVGKQENVGENNSNMYTIEKKDGSKVGVWGSSLLDGRFGGIFIGEEVKIVYLGKETSKKSGRGYHNFAFYHRPVKKS